MFRKSPKSTVITFVWSRYGHVIKTNTNQQIQKQDFRRDLRFNVGKPGLSLKTVNCMQSIHVSYERKNKKNFKERPHYTCLTRYVNIFSSDTGRCPKSKSFFRSSLNPHVSDPIQGKPLSSPTCLLEKTAPATQRNAV